MSKKTTLLMITLLMTAVVSMTFWSLGSVAAAEKACVCGDKCPCPEGKCECGDACACTEACGKACAASCTCPEGACVCDGAGKCAAAKSKGCATTDKSCGSKTSGTACCAR